MSLTKVKDFLDSRKIKYIAIWHSLAYTSAEIAALAHIRGKEFAKTVIVKIDGVLTMAVVSAPQHVNLALLKAATRAKSVELATEDEFKERFPDCELGAMPPFGNLYGMDVLVDESLAGDKQIAFNAGTHHELIQMSWNDFERLVRPRPINLVRRASGVA